MDEMRGAVYSPSLFILLSLMYEQLFVTPYMLFIAFALPAVFVSSKVIRMNILLTDGSGRHGLH
jgi:hypothetical protein